jgi:hypothetical protein
VCWKVYSDKWFLVLLDNLSNKNEAENDVRLAEGLEMTLFLVMVVHQLKALFVSYRTI